jgi:hypothetical protein
MFWCRGMLLAENGVASELSRFFRVSRGLDSCARCSFALIFSDEAKLYQLILSSAGSRDPRSQDMVAV